MVDSAQSNYRIEGCRRSKRRGNTVTLYFLMTTESDSSLPFYATGADIKDHHCSPRRSPDLSFGLVDCQAPAVL